VRAHTMCLSLCVGGGCVGAWVRERAGAWVRGRVGACG
jgi:hypothetical protein